jgi:hypothetical protein
MFDITPQYITDAAGNRLSVILDLATYRMLLEALEELEGLRALDEAVKEGSASVPFDEATPGEPSSP